MYSMNAPTNPAPSTTTIAPAPGCPYECLRLGLGLRFKDAARLAWLVLVTAVLAAGCAVRTDATEPTDTKPATPPVVCYAQEARTPGDYRANVHCVDPVTDISTAQCVSLADTRVAEPCSVMMGGLACAAVDADTWRCEIPCDEWIKDGEVYAPAIGDLNTYHVSEGCTLTPVGKDVCEKDITLTTETPAGEPVQIWHRAGEFSCAVTMVKR